MVMEFSTFGSCASRNIFASAINKNYKDYFSINKSIEMVTLISLMSKPVDYDSSLINSDNNYDNFCVNEDLSKSYLDFIRMANIDYVVFDTYFDVMANSVIIDEETIITYSPRLMHTDFFNQVKDYPKINIVNDFDYYFDLWKNAWGKFYKILNEECGDLKIILNCSRAVYKYYKDEIIYEDSNLFNQVPSHHNRYRNILDSYILKNFDVECLPFNECLLDTNHIFGIHPTHYESKFYDEKNRQLNSIIRRNNTLRYDDEINVEFRDMKRKLVYMSFK